MAGNINQIKVVDFVRSTMGPVPMETLLKQFGTGRRNDVNLKRQLNQALRSALKSGQLQQCNNYYFSSSLDEDLRDWIDLTTMENRPLDDESSDAASFSSCESSENTRAEESVEQMGMMLCSNEGSKTTSTYDSTQSILE